MFNNGVIDVGKFLFYFYVFSDGIIFFDFFLVRVSFRFNFLFF